MAQTLPSALEALVIPEPVRVVVAGLQQRGHAALLVGGAVRDALLGKSPQEFDVATSARPEDVQRAFRKVIPTGIDHGTVTVIERSVPIEVTTFRTEGAYLDGRRPSSVEFRTEIDDDLSRRDFTMNAMAFDPIARRLVDPFGGQADLAGGRIRCVGSAQARFSEDGLRPLRAVRFAAVLGFALDPETEAAIPATLEVFRRVSRERIRVEFEKLLLSRRPEVGLSLLESTGLLACFLPEARGDGFSARVEAVRRAPRGLEVRLAALLAAVPSAAARDALRSLTFPNKVSERVGVLRAHPVPGDAASATDAALRRWMAAAGRDVVPDALEVFIAQGGDPEIRLRIEALLGQAPPLTARELALDGAAIMKALGIGPSRAVGEATRFLLDQVLEDPARNSPEKLGELLLTWRSARGS